MLNRLYPYAPSVVRIGVSLVYLWFGLSQIISPEDWSAWLPAWTFFLPIDAMTLIYLNGAFETLLGAALLVGVSVRAVAALLTLHMLHIVATVGYNDIGVRDFGIAVATLGVFLFGPDMLSFESRRKAAQ
jgi:uncharacterized membrane protein YphA (DoxX/SURF4 family)